MHHQHAGQLSSGLRWTGQVPPDVFVALWRGYRRVLGLDTAVVLGDLLRPRVIRAEALPDGRGSHAAYRELFRAIQEFAAVDIAVNVTVKEVQQLLREIRGFLPVHVKGSFPRQRIPHHPAALSWPK